MPRKARIDAASALHHIICRGIERRESVKARSLITQPSVSRAVRRGEKLAIENNLYLENELKDQIA
jgi:hypothetical protein